LQPGGRKPNYQDMLNRIRQLFEAADGPAHGKTTSQHGRDDLKLAAACLLIEAARSDGDFGDDERKTIARVLRRYFELTEAECDDLLAAGERRQADADHLLRFTQTIKSRFPMEERIEIIEMLWEVAYSDGVLHDLEAHLLRKIGGLIYVSDRDRGEARQRVLQRIAAK
jgi:uncharacterized tellurite resistance protein B-like protein